MLSSNQKNISATSYTNKDFESVYSELLDLVKVLTYRWDPSISNESDPGVILLKLNAVIADKCNYNSDKNVLECFPLSVTQEQNARQLFAQLGYYMKWYTSATTEVSLKWVAKEIDYSYTIPPFTMVTNEDKSVVYSLLGPATGRRNNVYNISAQKLTCDGTPLTFKAMQGVAINYTINGQTDITIDYLDNLNRLYFDSTDVAENGIFITNIGENNYQDWVKKDNLIAEAMANTFYKFGVSDDGQYCYIEFPEDADALFKQGINITYIRTTGKEGNIKAKELTQFYNDISVVGPSGNFSTLNSENVYITNPAGVANGDDPEDIDKAYKNYQRVVGTFNTLVTLRDYINYILRSGLVSNGFVCDRTNDIQSTYKIMSLQNDINQLVTYVEKQQKVPDLTAYSIKLYLLQYVDVVDSYAAFDKTFSMITPDKLNAVTTYLQDVKSIQHDYVDVRGIDGRTSNICYLKNKYVLDFDIIPQYQLNTVEIDEVRDSIRNALYNELQSKNLEFGQQISYEDVVQIVEDSDVRIKFARLAPLQYSTWAIYFDGKEFKEVNISDTDNLIDIVAPDNTKIDVDRAIFEKAVGVGNYATQVFIYSEGVWEHDGTTVNLADFGITATGTFSDNDQISITVSPVGRIREEIYAKSVLAGVTQFLVKDEEFEYTFEQSATTGVENSTQTVRNISKLSSNVDIVFNNYHTEYALRSNETLQLYSPSMIDVASYGDYVKFEYFVKTDVAANSSRQLAPDEYVLFYWKQDNEQSAIYKYAMYGQGNVISPTFSLSAKTSEADIVGAVLKSELHNVGEVTNPVLQASSDSDGAITLSLSQRIQALGNANILSGKDKVKIRKVNTITLSENIYFYWILNNVSEGRYILFDKDSLEKEYILNVGEYIFYTDAKRTDLAILGAGTKIQINNTSIEYSVPVLNKSAVLKNGTDEIEGSWFVLPKNSTLKVTETYYMNISPGNVFRMTPIQTYTSWSATFNSKGVTFTGGPVNLSSFNLYYKLNANDYTWTPIEHVQLQGYSGWESRSLLGVNVADDVEQVLLANQSVKCYLSDGTTQVINGADLVQGKYPVCILASHPISLNGAQTTNTTYTKDEILYYENFYQYGRYISKHFPGVEYTSDNTIVLTFPASNSLETVYFDFSLPDGDYIVNVQNGYTNVDSAQVFLDGVLLGRIHNSSLTDLSKKGTYNMYMKIDNSVPLPAGQVEHRIEVKVKTNNNTECIITVGNPYRYRMPDHFSKFKSGDILFENMKQLISLLDADDLFDWSYVVDESMAIPEPLDPYSFLSGNHIYNPFTICQLEQVSDSNVKVVNRR